MNSVEDGSERSIQLGGSYMVGGEIFPENADYIALGHVHKPQKVPGCPKARYSGSPLPFNVRETSFDKQVIAVTLTAGSPCIIRELPLPVYKPIEVWHCEKIDDAVEQCEANADRECWVYLEVKTDHYIHDEDFKKYLKKTRAMADDMETATLFSCGFANHIPTGALLLVSDQPMIPEGVKTDKSDSIVTQNYVTEHVDIGIASLRMIIDDKKTV